MNRVVYLNEEINKWTPPVPPPTEGGEPDALAGKLLILQAYGSSGDAAGASHSFVELYNNTDTPINLSGITLYHANGTRGLPRAEQDGQWRMIPLTGTIPAKGSYLIAGPRQSTAARYQILDNYGDINDSGFTLGNRSFKVALIRSTAALTVQNPFNIDGNGTTAKGYIDMVGSANDPSHASNPDQILGFEIAPARNSASEAVRRKDLNDTNNNSVDFIAARYAASNGLTDEELEERRPRNSSAGSWDPFPIPQVPPPDPTGNTLLILQIGAATDGHVSRSFVELYNAGNTEVNLSGYSLQYAAGARGLEITQDGSLAKIDLSGTIPPHHSFLILSSDDPDQYETTGGTPALVFDTGYGDINLSDFRISNRSYKVVLMNNTTLLTVQNPFNIDGAWTKAPGYVDMVGAMNTPGGTNPDNIFGYEINPIGDLNKQTGQRRTSLTDTDNNAADFARAVFANADTETMERLRPKNLTYGAWNPITGVQE